MEIQRFADLLRPVTETLRDLSLVDAAAAQSTLDRVLPVDGPMIQHVRDAAVAGAEAGWLLPKSAESLRFGRVAKELSGFSVDAVLMSAKGPRHRHPNGEIDLCFQLDGAPTFDGQPPGWVVYGPGSEHVPTVKGGDMLILYFLPGGAIEWL